MSTHGAGDEPDGPVDDDVFEQLVEASEALEELPDAARVEAWASSVLGVWAEAPDATVIDDELVGWLTRRTDAASARLLLALSGLVAVPQGVLDVARTALDPVPAWVAHVGTAQPTRAWRVLQRGVVSIGIGFRLGDGSEHSLLADVVDLELSSLIVAPGPDELFDGSEDLVAPQATTVAEAASTVVEVWRRLLAGDGEIPESVFVNGALARRRLEALVGQDLADLRPENSEDDLVVDVMDPGQRAELDGWALSVLDGAGVGAGVAAPQVLVDPLVPARTATYPQAEREAFGALEWADWLGAVIGLARTPVGTDIGPALLVDLINRCPEVTSTIPKRDRPYYEWAFSLVLPLWRDGGVLDAGDALSADGAQRLVGALREVWTHPGPV